MFLRVGYLWSVLVVLTLSISYRLMSRETLASYSYRILREDALQIAQSQGALVLYLSSVATGIFECLPYIGAGLFLGSVCRLVSLARFVRRRRRDSQIHKLVDRYGVSISMYHAALEHNPNVRDLPIGEVDTSRLPAATSPLEVDAMRLLAAHSAIPADLDGHHGTSLAEHSYSVWQAACARHGAGTVEAQLAICHDLGKIRAYAKDSSGRWAMQGMHQPLSLQIVRDLDAFVLMPESKRREFIDLFTALQTGSIPADFTEHERSILRAAQHADFKTTAQEKDAVAALEAETEAEPPLDAMALRDLLESSIFDVVAKMNINRALDVGAQLEGFYIAESKVLFVPEKWIRKRIAEILPDEITRPLELTLPSNKSIHPARNITVETMRLLFDTYDVFDDKPAKDGTFRLQSGVRTVEDVIAIKTTDFPEAITRIWGKWKNEIDIL